MTFPETLVARVTGISKRQVAITRKATPSIAKGPDWSVENSCVAYTGDGLKKICAALGVEAAALQWPTAALTDNEPTDAEVEETQGSTAPEQPSLATIEPFPIVAPTSELPELSNQIAAATVAAGVEQLQAAAQLVEIVVTKATPNPRTVLGVIELGGEGLVRARAVVVGVRDNKNFKPGMRLKAHHAGGDYYRMFGNCPRWPGRW